MAGCGWHGAGHFGSSAGAQAEAAILLLRLQTFHQGLVCRLRSISVRISGPAAVTMRSAASSTPATSPSGMSGSSSTLRADERADHEAPVDDVVLVARDSLPGSAKALRARG